MMLATTRRSTTRRAAFTLLEVLVVVAILVILATVATIATTSYLEGAKKTKAQLGCETINKAIKAYQMDPRNPGQTDEDKLPSGQQDLIRPFGSNSSFLEGSGNDLNDPWGNEYKFERRTRADQTVFIVVRTTAPDGTPITQYGQGPNAEPRQP